MPAVGRGLAFGGCHHRCVGAPLAGLATARCPRCIVRSPRWVIGGGRRPQLVRAAPSSPRDPSRAAQAASPPRGRDPKRHVHPKTVPRASVGKSVPFPYCTPGAAPSRREHSRGCARLAVGSAGADARAATARQRRGDGGAPPTAASRGQRPRGAAAVPTRPPPSSRPGGIPRSARRQRCSTAASCCLARFGCPHGVCPWWAALAPWPLRRRRSPAAAAGTASPPTCRPPCASRGPRTP